MESIENFEDKIELACEYEVKRIFDTKLTVYKFTTSWKFVVPLDGKNHEFVSPEMITRHEDNFDFAWRLGCKVGRGNYPNNFSMSLLRFDKQHLELCVRCYLVDDAVAGFSPQKLLTEEWNFDFREKAPIKLEFSLWDDLRRLFQERIVDLLKSEENQLCTIDRLPMTVKVDFEFSEIDDHIYTSLKLAKDLETMLRSNDELTDVTFEIDGKEIKAHKCILAARSPVFAKMFKAQETHDNRYRIDDIDADLFQHLLVFVYCGKIDDTISSIQLTNLRIEAKKFELKI